MKQLCHGYLAAILAVLTSLASYDASAAAQRIWEGGVSAMPPTGEYCYATASSGDAVINIGGTPGGGLHLTIDNISIEEQFVLWQVDDHRPYHLKATNTDGGGTDFNYPPVSLVMKMLSGKKLTIISSDKKLIKRVSLAGSKDVLSGFLDCWRGIARTQDEWICAKAPDFCKPNTETIIEGECKSAKLNGIDVRATCGETLRISGLEENLIAFTIDVTPEGQPEWDQTRTLGLFFATLGRQSSDGSTVYATIAGVTVQRTEDMTDVGRIFDVTGACAFMTSPSGLSSGKAEIDCHAAAMTEGLSEKEYSFTFRQTKPFSNIGTDEGRSITDNEPSNQAGEGEMDKKWMFSLVEEDWGPACFVSMQKDSLQIGFMAAPGGDIVAYIDGLNLQSTQAIWRVDSQKTHVITGEISDYSGWLEFALASPELINELTQGSTLNISVVGKEKYALDVSQKAFTQFIDCQSSRKSLPASK